MAHASLENLWQKYISKSATRAEVEELFALLEHPAYYSAFEEMFIHKVSQSAPVENWDTARWNEVVDKIVKRGKPKIVRPLLYRIWWAACIVLLAGSVGLYVWSSARHDADSAVVRKKAAEQLVMPGINGAILTLGDGRQIVLDSLGNVVVADQSGVQVVLNEGQLAYNTSKESPKEVVYNIVSTPKGRQFNMQLPDGTRVWLNAASSIRYPTIFTGPERQVQMTGEAYFEVAKSKGQPFKVNVIDRAEVAVLGTHFNINAYKVDGGIDATLLEGAVQVAIRGDSLSKHKTTVVLTPGQQAQVADKIHVVPHADTDKIMAWKNGLFNFEGAGLQEVMSQLERWYDIEVLFENGVPDIEFEGKITRDVSLNELLPALKKMGVSYRLEGRTLTILP